MKKREKALNNKGFSLVELIIVIAIMAVLIGVLTPQYIKYLDKSKVAVDTTLADNLRQAMLTTYLDPDKAIQAALPTGTDEDIPDNSPLNKYWTEVYNILGVANGAELEGKLKYKVGTTAPSITFTVDGNKNIEVEVIYAASDSHNISIK